MAPAGAMLRAVHPALIQSHGDCDFVGRPANRVPERARAGLGDARAT